jgi:hypothetical protein
VFVDGRLSPGGRVATRYVHVRDGVGAVWPVGLLGVVGVWCFEGRGLETGLWGGWRGEVERYSPDYGSPAPVPARVKEWLGCFQPRGYMFSGRLQQVPARRSPNVDTHRHPKSKQTCSLSRLLAQADSTNLQQKATDPGKMNNVIYHHVVAITIW